MIIKVLKKPIDFLKLWLKSKPFFYPFYCKLVHRFRGYVATKSYSYNKTLANRHSHISGSAIAKLAKLDMQFFLVMFVKAGQEKEYQEAIQSVISQNFSNWFLLVYVAEDAVILQKDAIDPRIEIEVVQQVIAARFLSNWVKDKSTDVHETSTFLGIVSSPIILEPQALFDVAKSFYQNPSSKMLYTDHDVLSPNGRRHNPVFKPDYNYDLLLSKNYIGPLLFISAGLKDFWQYAEGLTESSELYHLLLRLSTRLKYDQNYHLPRAIYSQLDVADSIAQEKLVTDCKAVQRYFDEQSRDDVAVSLSADQMNCIKWPLPDDPPLVSLIIPTRDGYAILKQCIDSILHLTEYSNYELVIVDNQSSCKLTLDYLDQLSEYHHVTILRYSRPFNYSAINNYAVSHCNGEIVALVNNDIEVISPGWLTEMVSHAVRPEIGCVGAKLYYPNNTIQHAGVIVGIGGVASHAHKHFKRSADGYCGRLKCVQNFSAVTAACLVVQKSVYDQVGGLNEQHLKVAFNDVDFCLRVQALGLRNLWTPYAELYHHESVSRGFDVSPEKRARFLSEVDYMKKSWPDMIQHDPAYNPNLTRWREDFTIRLVNEPDIK